MTSRGDGPCLFVRTGIERPVVDAAAPEVRAGGAWFVPLGVGYTPDHNYPTIESGKISEQKGRNFDSGVRFSESATSISTLEKFPK